MDLTNFIVSGRDNALLYGDHATYRTQLGRRLLTCRKKLGISTRNRAKYKPKEPVTARNIRENNAYLHLLLLTSERAWAHAMAMKTSHATDTKGIAGKTRSHIVSRLTKAARTAEQLCGLLSQPESESESGATARDMLEARAYASMLKGAAQFENQSWEACLNSYAVARVIYSALLACLKSDLFKDLLAETIDPSIRYASYQLKTPRTIPIPTIAREHFPQSDSLLTTQVNKLDRTILSPETASAADSMAAENAPRTLAWRSREVPIEDAAIAQSWGSVLAAKSRLQESFGSASGDSPKKVAAAYDGVLMASQEAADDTKKAIDELNEEGAAQSDPRMQSLQITRTAVNYEMISWRVGRNRILTGPYDGVHEDANARRRRVPRPKPGKPARGREEKPRQRITRLKEKVALYDGTLNNLEAARALPGIAADSSLSERLAAIESYFLALKCLAIARSHSVAGDLANALALIHHGYELSEKALSMLSKTAEPSFPDSPLSIDVAPETAQVVHDVLAGELHRHRALIHLQNVKAAGAEETTARMGIQEPLIDRLNDCAVGEVDLQKIVQLPPRLMPIPAKPIFLDIAWNYIDYPGRGSGSGAGAASAGAAQAQVQAQASETAPEQAKSRSGWFGFGR